jgi:hypothetical protein
MSCYIVSNVTNALLTPTGLCRLPQHTSHRLWLGRCTCPRGFHSGNPCSVMIGVDAQRKSTIGPDYRRTSVVVMYTRNVDCFKYIIGSARVQIIKKVMIIIITTALYAP